MYDLPTEFDLNCLPNLFTNEHIPASEKMIKIHLFSYQTDWFICEYNPHVKNMFGMMVIRADFEHAQWGYFTLPELEDIADNIMEIHWNKSFTPRTVRNLRPLRVNFEGKVRIYT